MPRESSEMFVPSYAVTEYMSGLTKPNLQTTIENLAVLEYDNLLHIERSCAGDELARITSVQITPLGLSYFERKSSEKREAFKAFWKTFFSQFFTGFISGILVAVIGAWIVRALFGAT